MKERLSADRSESQRRLIESWRFGHGLVALAATVLAFLIERPELVAGVGLLSFLVLSRLVSVPRAPDAPFNYANGVTIFRLVLGATLILTANYLAPAFTAAQLVSLWILDGLDGLLARRFETVSVLGATLDKEADAFIVLNVCLALIQQERVGPWILMIGLVRYTYLILLGLTRRVSKSPPSRLGTFTAGFTHLVLALGFLLHSRLHTGLLIIATILLLISYGRAVYHAFR
jgi:phosphatidylglycerophosphate synthase